MNLLDIIFPKRCIGCGKLGRYFCHKCIAEIKLIKGQICPVCQGAAIDGATHPRCKTRYSLDGLTSIFHYDGVIRKAVKSIKYRFVSDLAEEFISLIPSSTFQFLIHNSKFLILIPIPLHSSRLHFRGFNQAEVLGRILAKRLNTSMKTDILKRVKKTTPQVEVKDRKKRLQNMESVFSVNNLTINNRSRLSGIPRLQSRILDESEHDAVIPGKSGTASGQYNNATIILFDDVYTTGATLRSAANVLKRRGAKKVWGITLAHG